MKVWFPIEKSNNEEYLEYVSKCRSMIAVFKMCFNSCVNRSSLLRIERIMKENNMLDFLNKDRVSILQALNQYTASLKCYYDKRRNQCYYDTPKIVKCNNTTTSLEYVMRLIEFGNDLIPPTNLIRHSYNKFCEICKEVSK